MLRTTAATTLIVTFGVAAGLLIGYATTVAIGTSPDSSMYASAAQSLSSGTGLLFLAPAGVLTPLIHYPPLYSILLAGFISVGVAALDAMRVIAIATMTASVIAIGPIASTAAGSRYTSIIASIFLATSPAIVQVFAMGWTEGLFITLVLTSALCFRRHIDRPSWATLVLLGMSCALVFLVKFPGVSWLATVAAGIFAWRRIETPGRLREVAFVLFIGAVPTLIWVIRNALIAGDPWGRSVSFYLPPLVKIRQGFSTVLTWIIPEAWLRAAWDVLSARPSLLTLVVVMVGLLGVIIVILLARQAMQNLSVLTWVNLRSLSSMGGKPSLAILMSAFALTHLAMVAISMVTLDADTPLDTRKLSPSLVALVPAIAIGCERLWRGVRGMARGIAFGGLALILTVGFVQTILWATSAHARGIGYTAVAWRDSITMRRVSQLPPEVKVYSNHPSAVYLNTNRFAALLPIAWNPTTRQAIQSYDQDVAALRADILRGAAVVVIFDQAPTPDFTLSETDLRNSLPPTLVHDVGGGRLYSVL